MPERTVLIVDDLDDVRRLVARVGERAGCRVVDTDDPARVPYLLRKERPDVVVIDLIMPRVDGVELLRELSRAGFEGELVLMSGYDSTLLDNAARLARAYGLTPSAVLSKPLDVEALRAALAPRESVGA